MTEKSTTWNGVLTPWIKLYTSSWDAIYTQTIGQVLQLPPIGLHRNLTIKVMQTIDAWARLYPTSVAYQLVMAEVQLQALLLLAQELTSNADSNQPELNQPKLDWLQVQQLWSKTADKVFEQAFCSEDNLRIRGQLLNAANHYKRCQQNLLEEWLTGVNLPTRSEVDELHHSIYELRKEVKRLKLSLAQKESEPE